MLHHICKTCGGTLIEANGSWACKYCGNVYNDESVKKSEALLRSLLDEQKIEKVSNLRRNLYDALNAKYTDSIEICRICGEIKKLLPDDFMANFYYTANHGTQKEICEAIRSIDVEENFNYVEGIVNHMIRSLRNVYVLPLQNLVERAYKGTDMKKFEALSTEISDEAVKVNAGTYETSLPRDVFVAYSSRDMEEVEKLVEALENNSLTCFVAARNLRHGRGAVENYEKALHEAMDNCKWIVFVSSSNSRTMECDALRVELNYIKTQDIMNAPPEYKRDYESMPEQYKKKRIEYRIDNKESQEIAKRVLGEFFCGLEYACSPEEVLDRLYGINKKDSIPKPSVQASKFCSACGTENPPNTKFCIECGNKDFLSSRVEYDMLKKLEEKAKADEEARRAREAEERRIAEEKRRVEEARRAEEERLAKADRESEKILKFKLLDDGTYSVTIKSKNNCPKNIVIPRTYNGKEVTSIGWGAFGGCTSLTSITIPDSVTSIGDYAFYECTNLTSITIGNSVTSIGYSAFCECTSLVSITIPDSVTSIGDYAFYKCTNLTSITIGNSMTSIGKYTFSYCTSLTSITIPDSVTSIGEGAFNGCESLTSITIPDSVTSIGKGAFSYCTSLTSITIPQSVLDKGISSFLDKSKLTNVVIQKGATRISSKAFYGYTSLTSVTIPDGVTSIGDYAFYECTNLKSIKFKGTKAQWSSINKGKGWKKGCPAITVTFSDGTSKKLSKLFG